MTKHSKRKFVGNFKVDFKIGTSGVAKEHAKSISEVDLDKYPEAFLQLEDNTILKGFVFQNNGKPIIIPEPEPSILYFTNSERKLSELLELQSELLSSKLTRKNFSELSHTFYNFFQLSSDFIINLYTAIEAFNNSLITKDVNIKYRNKNYNKERIEREARYLDKIKIFTPRIVGKSFLKKYPQGYEIMLSIKTLRDNVVHTKNMSLGFPASYRELYISYLKFDFEKSFETIKVYFNFYKENWIEDCNCGA